MGMNLAIHKLSKDLKNSLPFLYVALEIPTSDLGYKKCRRKIELFPNLNYLIRILIYINTK